LTPFHGIWQNGLTPFHGIWQNGLTPFRGIWQNGLTPFGETGRLVKLADAPDPKASAGVSLS
jgi:hypothetical protein